MGANNGGADLMISKQLLVWTGVAGERKDPVSCLESVCLRLSNREEKEAGIRLRVNSGGCSWPRTIMEDLSG